MHYIGAQWLSLSFCAYDKLGNILAVKRFCGAGERLRRRHAINKLIRMNDPQDLTAGDMSAAWIYTRALGSNTGARPVIPAPAPLRPPARDYPDLRLRRQRRKGQADGV